jgi:hypothetical protein
MSAETDLYAVLSGAAGVTALVSTRIYPDVVPEEATLPAIAYQRTSTEYSTTIHGGAPVAETPTIEITCVATTRPGANAVANAVIASLAGTDFVAVDQQAALDINGSESDLYGAIVIVNINL